jgi:protease-4
MMEPGNREYYLACAADRIFFTPNSPFTLTGLAARVYFFKGLMDKIGVEFESFRSGAYKSFNEVFTREHMSDAFRENMTALVTDLNDQFVADIMADRGLSRAEVDDLLRRGFMTPDEAAAARFVDRVAYHDEVIEEIGGRPGLMGIDAYARLKVIRPAWGPVQRVALVVIEGSIVSGEDFDTGWFRSIGDATYGKALEKAFADPMVRAVVIRINSGGGGASASDYMWRELARLKKKYGKPVVFSFGNTAASGGYYVACTGDPIFSERGTVTGSIGVVFGKLTLVELYRKLGINKDVIRMSEFADIFSESRRLTDRERGLLQKGVDFVYERFTGRVIEARKIGKDEISRVAEGRVFTGRQARERRLTDEEGGIAAALEYARHLAGIEGYFEVAMLPDERRGLFEFFDTPRLLKLLQTHMRGLIGGAEHIGLAAEGALYLFPYRIEVW